MLAAVLAVLLLATNAFGGAGITAFADDTPEGAVSVTVPMSLALDAKAAAKTKTYTFVMAPEGTAPAVANGTVTLTAAGEGSFGPVVFTEPGDFTYKIRQTTTAEDGFILDPAVYDQLLQRDPRDLPAYRIKSREHDRIRCVIDDQFDA